jgi:hypothetical protein
MIWMLRLLALVLFVIGSPEPAVARPVEIAPQDVVTVLPRDAIPAIDRPQFVKGSDPAARLARDERVLGLSLNGDHRAYPIVILSVHEIVNDVVGGVPVTVTW